MNNLNNDEIVLISLFLVDCSSVINLARTCTNCHEAIHHYQSNLWQIQSRYLNGRIIPTPPDWRIDTLVTHKRIRSAINWHRGIYRKIVYSRESKIPPSTFMSDNSIKTRIITSVSANQVHIVHVVQEFSQIQSNSTFEITITPLSTTTDLDKILDVKFTSKLPVTELRTFNKYYNARKILLGHIHPNNPKKKSNDTGLFSIHVMKSVDHLFRHKPTTSVMKPFCTHLFQAKTVGDVEKLVGKSVLISDCEKYLVSYCNDGYLRIWLLPNSLVETPSVTAKEPESKQKQLHRPLFSKTSTVTEKPVVVLPAAEHKVPSEIQDVILTWSNNTLLICNGVCTELIKINTAENGIFLLSVKSARLRSEAIVAASLYCDEEKKILYELLGYNNNKCMFQKLTYDATKSSYVKTFGVSFYGSLLPALRIFYDYVKEMIWCATLADIQRYHFKNEMAVRNQYVQVGGTEKIIDMKPVMDARVVVFVTRATVDRQTVLGMKVYDMDTFQLLYEQKDSVRLQKDVIPTSKPEELTGNWSFLVNGSKLTFVYTNKGIEQISIRDFGVPLL
jgi:CRISPR/Cas system-associated protein endoribonuclease Cas2